MLSIVTANISIYILEYNSTYIGSFQNGIVEIVMCLEGIGKSYEVLGGPTGPWRA